jgi:integrase
VARPSTGSVVEDHRGDVPRYGIRFRDQYGKRRYESLGEVAKADAEEALDKRLAEVKLHIYQPPAKKSVVELPADEPTFWQYADEWMATRRAEGLAKKTIVDLEWSLNRHLIWFGHHRLSDITPREVKRYTQAKLAERSAIEEARAAAIAKGEPFTDRPLSNGSINHTLRHLAQVLESAVDDELLGSNPAAGSRRRLKASKPARPWVEPEQLMSLLGSSDGVGHVLLEVLAGGGLRIGEALALRWRDIEVGTGTLYVRAAKTSAGVREVHLTPALRETLMLWRVDAKHTGAADFVVQTSTGRNHNPSNLRRDVLAPAVEAANVKLVEAGIAPIGRLTFHSLRRTYASLRCAVGDDVRYTAAQLGHEDPRFTLRVYAQATSRRDRMAKPQRDAYDAALHWAAMGSNVDLTLVEAEVEAA